MLSAFFPHRLRWAGTFTAVAVLAGCAAPGNPSPPMLQAAARLTRTGEEAYLTGRAGEAVPALNDAVRLHLAAGDLPGATRALLNLALAQRAAGDLAAAVATAERLHSLTPAAQQQVREQGGKEESSAELAAASAWLDALLALDRGDSTAAAGFVASLVEKLPGSSPWPGRLETLRAEIALNEGRLPEALARARAGRAASAAARDRAEEARALQFAGAAEIRLGRWHEARADLLAALKIEEALGAGTRMAGDLRQLAIIAENLGDASEARLYKQRADAITDARIR